jgi:hypothetical protein
MKKVLPLFPLRRDAIFRDPDAAGGFALLFGTPNHDAIASYFAKHPERLPLMARMADDVKRATDAAAEAAITAVMQSR